MTRLNVVLIVVLALQVGALALSRLVVGESFEPRRTFAGEELFPSVVPEQVASLTVMRGERVTELKRDAGTWVVASEGGAPADTAAIEQAVKALDELAPGAVVSENPDKHELFDVTGPNAVRVTARSNSGGVAAELVIGKNTPDWSGVYVRYPVDSPDVMLVPKNVRHLFDRGENQPGAWRDKTIFKDDPLAVRSFEILRGDQTIVIERQLKGAQEGADGAEGAAVASSEDDWKVVQPVSGPMNRFTGNQLATSVADLKTESFAGADASPAELGLDPPEARVTATFADGHTLVLEIGKEEDGKRYARVPGRADVYRVPSYRLDTFLRDPDTLLAKPPEPEDVEEDGEEEQAEGDATTEEPEADGEEPKADEPPAGEPPPADEPTEPAPKQDEPEEPGGGG